MDPYAVLGVSADAPPEEVTAAYRRLAKRWHPDRNADAREQAERRMAEINAAYELLRSARWQDRPRHGAARAGAAPDTGRWDWSRVPYMTAPAPRRRPAGHWLPETTRRALGPELLAALEEGEQVRLVTPTSVWASPQALLAVTDRRLLWLLDDAVTGRVRSLRFPGITGTEMRLRWPRRRTAVVRVSRRDGRRPVSFSELRPETARALTHLIDERTAAPGAARGDRAG
jgi:hypothetical protein